MNDPSLRIEAHFFLGLVATRAQPLLFGNPAIGDFDRKLASAALALLLDDDLLGVVIAR